MVADTQPLVPDPRQDPQRILEEAVTRLEQQLTGETVAPPVTDVDRVVDWYAADLHVQIEDYLNKAYADIVKRLMTPEEPPEVKERRRQEAAARREREAEEQRRRDEEAAKKAAEEAREREIHIAEFTECLQAGRVRVWLSEGYDPRQFYGTPGVSDLWFTEVAEVSDLVCPVCGRVPPDLDRLILLGGSLLLSRSDRLQGLRPDPAHRGHVPIEETQRPKLFAIHCPCGNTFVYAPDYTYVGAYLPEDERKIKRYRTEFSECLQAGRVRVWLPEVRDPDRFTEVADVSDLVCPACGQVPPEIEKRILDMGKMLLTRPDRHPGRRPDPAHRGPLPIESAPRANKFPIRCTCGRTFVAANAYVSPGAYLPEEGT